MFLRLFYMLLCGVRCVHGAPTAWRTGRWPQRPGAAPGTGQRCVLAQSLGPVHPVPDQHTHTGAHPCTHSHTPDTCTDIWGFNKSCGWLIKGRFCVIFSVFLLLRLTGCLMSWRWLCCCCVTLCSTCFPPRLLSVCVRLLSGRLLLGFRLFHFSVLSPFSPAELL